MMGLEIEEDIKRKPIELNLLAARKRQSAQTGYVHYCYEAPYSQQHDTIPILENFCFVLALLRSRTIENVSEAKALLTKLLPFENQGNFSVYLHEYPQCRDRLVSIHILPILYWILEDFHSILGVTLKNQLTDLKERITQYGFLCKTSDHLSKQAESKLFACLGDKNCLVWEPQSTGDWGHYLTAWQILSPGSIPQIDWNTHFHAYTGPNKRPFHEKGQPAISLFDLFMGAWTLSYSDRLLQDHPSHLHAALIQPFPGPERFDPSPFTVRFNEMAEIPFSLWWGSKEYTHSLVCPAKKSSVSAKEDQNLWDLDFILTEPLAEDGQDQSEICFFCNLHPDHQIFINGQKATAFRMGDTIEIRSRGLQIKLSFLAEEGTFFGHIGRSNRPYQRCAIGENLHESYDLLIALRTVRRPAPCKVKVTIEILNS